MIPKISTVFLHEKDTIRQGLERFMVHGYTAVPVLNDQEQYIGSVTEGDFLRHLLVCQTTDLKVQEGYRLGSIVRRDFCPALQIDADSEQVVTSMLNQNFVPIVDGRNVLFWHVFPRRHPTQKSFGLLQGWQEPFGEHLPLFM